MKKLRDEVRTCIFGCHLRRCIKYVISALGTADSLEQLLCSPQKKNEIII